MSSPSFVARLAAAAIVSVAASSAASAQGTFTYLPGPAYDVSADGAKVVGVDANGAYIYDINSNTFNAIGPATTALGISADGNHVIGDIDDPNNNESAGWWDPTFGWTALGTFPGFGGCGSSISSAYEISHDGTTVVGLGWQGCSARAFKWTAGTGVVQLQGLVSSDGTRANSISGDGRYVGGWETVGAANPRRATLWGPSGPPTLILQSGINTSGAGEIIDMNRDGSVVCGIHANQAFVWTKTTGVTLIPKLPGVTGTVYAQAVSDDGAVVFGSGSAFAGQPWVWTQAGGTQSLATFLTNQGIGGFNPSDLLVATGMSADGSVLCGWGFGGGWVIQWSRPATWVNLGGELAGSNGQSPELVGYGGMVAGQHVGLSLTKTLPNAPATLVLGTSPINQPINGGLLVPFPQVVLPGLFTNAAGELALSAPWPPSVPSGIGLYFQYWLGDGGNPFGVSATNAVVAITP
jgi:hypothetical protein